MTQLSVVESTQRLRRRSDARFAGPLETLLASASAVDATLYDHSRMVATVSVAVGCELGLTRSELWILELAAIVHDVGKSRLPRRILVKPAPLDDGEWAQMRRHPVLGADLVADLVPEPVAEIVRSHHERWDGTGYPDGFVGDRIPQGARIIAVADAFCAMTETRPYRAPASATTARAELLAAAGTQFDPACARAAVRVTAHPA